MMHPTTPTISHVTIADRLPGHNAPHIMYRTLSHVSGDTGPGVVYPGMRLSRALTPGGNPVDTSQPALPNYHRALGDPASIGFMSYVEAQVAFVSSRTNADLANKSFSRDAPNKLIQRSNSRYHHSKCYPGSCTWLFKYSTDDCWHFGMGFWKHFRCTLSALIATRIFAYWSLGNSFYFIRRLLVLFCRYIIMTPSLRGGLTYQKDDSSLHSSI